MTGLYETPAFYRLRGLLKAGGWRADDRLIAASMPHFIDEIGAADTLASLQNLGLGLSTRQARVDQISQDDLPCLFIPKAGPVFSVLEQKDERLRVHRHNEEGTTWVTPDRARGTVVRVPHMGDGSDGLVQPEGPNDLFRSYSSVFGSVFLVSIVTNILAFASPLFVMSIYDRVIPVASLEFLLSLLMGMTLVLAADLALRVLRSKALAFIGGGVDRFMGRLLFRKLLALPLDQLLKSDLNQQLSRLRQFESLRGAFTGQVLISCLDLPCTLFFAAVIWMISPTLGLTITATTILFVLAFVISLPVQRAHNAASATSRMAQQAMHSEIITHQRSLNRLGAVDTWLDRAVDLSAKAAHDARAAKEAGIITQSFGQTLLMFAGGMTIFIGASEAISGDITLGGLVATMALVWRVLAPIQVLSASGSQIATHIQTYQQIARVAQMPEETRQGIRQTMVRAFKGRLEMTGATFRYSSVGDPAIIGLSFEVKPGEVLAIAGANGSGKSTVLKLLANFYPPLAGGIRLDGMDLRQIPVDVLRGAVSFTPQQSEFFHGSIAQNFRIANILASDEDIWKAIARMGLEDEIQALPDGINTRLTEELRNRMSRSVLQSLGIARGLVKDAAIYMFDEPSNGLDPKHNLAFERSVEHLRGAHTIVISSRFENQLRLADRVLLLNRGRAQMFEKNPAAATRLGELEQGILMR